MARGAVVDAARRNAHALGALVIKLNMQTQADMKDKTKCQTVAQ